MSTETILVLIAIVVEVIVYFVLMVKAWRVASNPERRDPNKGPQ